MSFERKPEDVKKDILAGNIKALREKGRAGGLESAATRLERKFLKAERIAEASHLENAVEVGGEILPPPPSINEGDTSGEQ